MDTVFVDYDDTLIGRIDMVDNCNFYSISPGGANEMKAVSCIRYALEKILGWSEDEVIKNFDDYTIKVMKLERFLDFIDFPDEVEKGDVRYILSLLYPNRIKISEQALVENTFMIVLNARRTENGNIKVTGENDEAVKQFPRDYFTGSIGFKRFCYCVKFLLENFYPISSIEEMYQFFLSNKGKEFLSEYRLKIPSEQFNINMLDVIRRITDEYPDSDLYYSYYSFIAAFSDIAKTDTQTMSITHD